MDLKSDEIFKTQDDWAKRMVAINGHSYRGMFQRDRDRILYSKEFRRLSGKTQVFAAGYDDNMRTRLTHTLEVSQIANTISKELGLNIYLTEAIALGHDVGHTPFGHIGERTLNHIMNGCSNFYNYNVDLDDSEKGFKHNLQGVKVVSKLEMINENEPGLNLTGYTMWGIMHHTSIVYKQCEFYKEDIENCRYKNENKNCSCKGKPSLGYYKNALTYYKDNKKAIPIINNRSDWTFEGLVVRVADEIAQRHHDIEDGVFARLLDLDELINNIKKYFGNYKSTIRKIDALVNKGVEVNTCFINQISKIIIDMYVTEFIKSAKNTLMNLAKEFDIKTNEEYKNKRDDIYKKYGISGIMMLLSFKKDFSKCDKLFKKLLMDCILQSEIAQKMDGKASYMIRELFKAYLTNPQQLPDDTIVKIVNEIQGNTPVMLDYVCATEASKARYKLRDALKKGNANTHKILLRTICDYIAGMTDSYAYRQYELLYGTSMMLSRKL